MPDIFIVHKKAKISWIKRLAMDFNTNATWVHESLKELTVKCIINDNGHFLTLGEIKERLKWNISIRL